MLISFFLLRIIFSKGFENFSLRTFFRRRGKFLRFEKFRGRLTVRGGGSGQSVSLVSGGGGGVQNWQKKRQLIFE